MAKPTIKSLQAEILGLEKRNEKLLDNKKEATDAFYRTSEDNEKLRGRNMRLSEAIIKLEEKIKKREEETDELREIALNLSKNLLIQ